MAETPESQKDAPKEAVRATREAEKKGYLGDGAEKPDYSQKSKTVMGR